MTLLDELLITNTSAAWGSFPESSSAHVMGPLKQQWFFFLGHLGTAETICKDNNDIFLPYEVNVEKDFCQQLPIYE